MKALLILLAVLGLLALLPLGVHARYDSGGPWFALVIGPVQVQLFPGKPKIEKTKKQKPKAAKVRKKQRIGGSIRDFYPFLQLVLDFWDQFFHKLRVSRLTIHVGFGGSGDPAKAALNYGRAWAAIGAIMPPLRHVLSIKKENISASCDFTRGEMQIFAELKATLFLGDLLTMALRHGLKGVKLFRAIKKATDHTISDKAVQANESSST